MGEHKHDQLKGSLYLMAGAFMFASMGAGIKVLSAEMSTSSVVFSRNLMGLILLLPWIIHQGLGPLKTKRFRLHLTRCGFGLTAMYSFFYCIGHIPLTDSILFSYTAPLFVPLVGWLWLKEQLERKVLFAVGLGFAGVLLIIRPGAGVMQPAAIVGLVSGALVAVAFVTIRKMSNTEPVGRTIFYFSALSTLVSGIVQAVQGDPIPQHCWWWILYTGLFATGGQFGLTKAYTYAPASQIGHFSYVSILFASAYGWFFWEETPDAWTLAGALVIGLAGIISIRRVRLPALLLNWTNWGSGQR